MLVLSRKLDEKILIGDNITITIVRLSGPTVRIGIEAPKDVTILRAEVPKKRQAQSVEQNDSVGDGGSETSRGGEGEMGSGGEQSGDMPKRMPALSLSVAGCVSKSSCATSSQTAQTSAARHSMGAGTAPLLRRAGRMGPAALRSMGRRF